MEEFEMVCERGLLAQIKEFVNLGLYPNEKCLNNLCKNKPTLQAVKYLISKGAKPTIKTAKILANAVSYKPLHYILEECEKNLINSNLQNNGDSDDEPNLHINSDSDDEPDQQPDQQAYQQQPDQQAYQQPDDKLDIQPNLQPDNKSDKDNKQDDKQDNKPDNKQDNKQDDKQDLQPDNKPDDKQDNKPDDKQDLQPDNKPDDKQDLQPDNKPDNNTVYMVGKNKVVIKKSKKATEKKIEPVTVTNNTDNQQNDTQINIVTIPIPTKNVGPRESIELCSKINKVLELKKTDVKITFSKLRDEILKYIKNNNLFDKNNKFIIKINKQLSELSNIKEGSYINFIEFDNFIKNIFIDNIKNDVISI
jgi:hypothetical protein